MGCGSGRYGPRLFSWSDERIDSYTGADIHAHDAWDALQHQDRRLRFIEADASDAKHTIPSGTNFILSQSAIEHIDADLDFFEHIRDYARDLGTSVLQVHLLPSPACLRLYLLHGVRQYTPRTISKITRLFDNGYALLYRLGGRACNQLHYRFITAPLILWRRGDFRVTRAAEYERHAIAAIERDMRQPQNSPAFYGLVIHTHPRKRLF